MTVAMATMTKHSSMKKKTSSLHVDYDEDVNDGHAINSSSEGMTTTATTNTPKSNSLSASVVAITSTSSAAASTTTLYDAVGFFTCMVVMELTLEGAYEAFPNLDSLPYAVTIFQFGCCFWLPVILSRGEALRTFPKTLHDCIPYISLSIVVFGSTCLASMSVRYVSYPTKVVFKSAKLIPTMIVATLLQQKGSNYTVLDYSAATLLCAGAAGYGWGGGNGSGGNDSLKHSSYMGISLLLVSIFCDAFTPNIQQRLMAPPSKPALPTSTTISNHHHDLPSSSILNKITSLFLPTDPTSSRGGGLGLSANALMTNANGIGCVGLIVFMTLSGSLGEAIHATLVHPSLLVYLSVIGMALSTAVWCYTRLIQSSGSVMAVAVATLRKVATVVLSYIVYPKTMTLTHVASGFLVLGGILLSSYSKQMQQRQRRPQPQASS